MSAVASVTPAGVADFLVKTHRDGEEVRRATAVLQPVDGEDEPAAYDMSDLLAAHPVHLDGAEMRDWYDARGIQYGPAFSGLTAAHTTEGPGGSVLAEVALPGSIRSQQGAYGSASRTPGRLLPGRRCAPRPARRHHRHADVAAGRSAPACARVDPQRALLLRAVDQCQRRGGRGRHRGARRARRGPARR